MRIAAINFKKEDKIFSTINFGGKYSYEFFNEDGIKIERHENKKYIDNFYAYQNNYLENITAIVGENGSGKTTLLEEIIYLLKENYWQYEQYTCIYEIYKDGSVETFIKSSFKYENLDFQFTSLENDVIDPISPKSQVIYYSPFIDFRDPIDEIINLKYDFIIKQDYGSGNLKNEDSSKTDPLFMHKRANDKRFIEFNNTKFRVEMLEKMNIPFESNFTIKFNEFQRPSTLSNIPSNFSTIVDRLYPKLEDDRTRIRNSNESSPKIQKNLLKIDILESLINQMVQIMNKKHDYLEEGTLPVWRSSLDFKNTHDLFYWFLENHKIKLGGPTDHRKGHYSEDKLVPFQALPEIETKDFLNYINKTIDNLVVNDDDDNSNFDWDNRAIRLSKDNVLELFELEDKYLFELSKYYSWGDLGSTENSFIDVKSLITFEYSRYKLSSGEVSFLNLFSRFYSHFNSEYFKKQLTCNFSYFYIFLDEADLGFHPKWKVRFIDILIKFVELFFTDKRINAKVQIIFTTHDPLTLSDIPNYNVHYLLRENTDNNSHKKSFGANIYDLLNNSFFLESPIGVFAEKKIDEVINWLNYKKDGTNKLNHKEKSQGYYKKVIELIDEPIIKSQLHKMNMEATKDTSYIEKEISRLQKLLSKR